LTTTPFGKARTLNIIGYEEVTLRW
jgi:hypothetical protein